jgi:uncharacterized protein YecE (DUF72 family)
VTCRNADLRYFLDVEFGKRSDLLDVSFALPTAAPRSLRALESGRADDEPWLRLGAPVWARRDWVGKLYPPEAQPREYLRHYAARVGAIELNASFYALPEAATLDGWRAETPEGFRFCPKVSQEITHDRGLRGAEAETAKFCERFLTLGARLGPALLQLPPWMAPDGLGLVDAFLAGLPAGFPVAVEFRHAAWFVRGALRDDALTVLERRRASAVITDVAGRRDACHASLTAPEVMVRFVGNAMHPTDRPRVEAWLDRLIEWRARGLERAYFFVHQPDNLLAPELLTVATEAARARGVRLPEITLNPGQLDLFRAQT